MSADPPSLEDLLRNPGLVSRLAPRALAALAARCSAAYAIIVSEQAGRLMIEEEVAAANGDGDSLLTIERAAERLGMTKDSLYRIAKTLPFAVKLGPGQLRFSASGIDRYIKAKMRK